MSKKTRNVTKEMIDDALVAISNALIAEGAMLPVDEQQLTDDDLNLFGEGRRASLLELRQRVEAMQQRPSRNVKENHTNLVSESMAMAARNGDQISQAVLERMVEDRVKAEQARMKK